jgi:hypothetical protein
MLDTQNQGPQCTACGSPMKLSAIEPSTRRAEICGRLPARVVEGFNNTSSKVR